MFNFIVKRLLGMIPMVFIITFLIYLGLELTPGDAVSHLISPELLANADPAKLEELRQLYGLNDPFLVRYFRWSLNCYKEILDIVFQVVFRLAKS